MTRNILLAVLRADLRLQDHQIFHLAAESASSSSSSSSSQHFKKPITHLLPIFVYDQRSIEVGGLPGLQKAAPAKEARTRAAGFWRCGEHRTSFLTHSVFDLQSRLRARNSDLSIWAGTPEKVVAAVIKALKDAGDEVEAVWMHKEVNTEEVNVEKKIEKALAESNTPIKFFHGKTLVHPDDLGFSIEELPDVFTQFRKRVESQGFRNPLPAPDKLKPFPEMPKVEEGPGVYSLGARKELSEVKPVLDALLKPLFDDPSPGNHTKLRSKELEGVASALPFKGGETEALERMEYYFGAKAGQAPAASYKETRNGLLGVDYSTKFSAALAHGLVSPRDIAQRAHQLDSSLGKGSRAGGGYWIIFELLWRDYFFYVGWKYGASLFTIKGIEETLDPKAAEQKAREWNYPSSLDDEKDAFVRWMRGETGVPLVDASQKELIETGFQSNRSRQNVASFLTKDLHFDWRLGAEYFESLLTDYDPNSNYGNWQYVAGVGNDPRSSRQFNQIKQAKDYDPKGDYLVTWLPPLKKLLPDRRNDVFHPWTQGPENVPEGYPKKPVVETGMWKSHYAPRDSSKNRWRNGGGGGGAAKRGGGGPGGGRGGGGRGRGGHHNHGQHGHNGQSGQNGQHGQHGQNGQQNGS
ncbi:unnamed protein product [Parajaminaea phylloscopi]